MKIFWKYCFAIVYIISFSNLHAATQVAIKEEIQIAYDPQDRPNLTAQNPLKGFSKFIFFPMIPARTNDAESIFKLVENELQQYGQVDKSKILKKTNQGEVIDLSVFKTGVTLIYEIENLTDLNGKELGVVRASLNMTTAIEIEKTKQISRPYIWSGNCFLKGSTEKDLETITSQSLSNLLGQFMSSYSLVNTTKPIFDLQGPN